MVKRRSLYFLLVIATVIVSVTSCIPASSLSKDIFGDIDRDGSTTSADALSVLRCSAALTQFDESELSIADVDKDGVITSSDAINILRASVLDENNSDKTDNSDSVSKNESVSSEPQKQEEPENPEPQQQEEPENPEPQQQEEPEYIEPQPSENNTNEMYHGHGNYVIILNTSTKKYHTTECRAAKKIKDENRDYYYVETPGGTYEDHCYLESFGYTHCGICK